MCPSSISSSTQPKQSVTDLAGSLSVRRKIRVKKEDSAFVYFILESYEGIASYSTLDFKKGDLYRDLELRIPADFLLEVEDLLQRLGEMVHGIE